MDGFLLVCVDHDAHGECNCIHYSRIVVNGDTIPVDCKNRTLLCQPSVRAS